MAPRNPNPPELPVVTTTVVFDPYDDKGVTKKHVTIRYVEKTDDDDILAVPLINGQFYVPISAAVTRLGGKVPAEMELTIKVLSYRPNNKLTTE